MIELLRRAAQQAPDATAVITDRATVSYAELTARADRMAGGLKERGIARFGVIHQDASDVLALLAAASLAGAEACVYPPLEHQGEGEGLAERFDHAVVITDGNQPPAVARLSPGELAEAAPAAGRPPVEQPHLVLTTGTTGVPKGVRHDWNRLLRPAGQIRPTPGQRWLLAFGLHQFAGLQILIHVAAAGATLVAPEPRRPQQGLAAMRGHGVTHASATPTFWRFLLAELRSDGRPRPLLEQITLGGEAVPDPLLAALRETFPEAQVSQIYAANESGSLRSVRDGRAGLPVSLLEAGEEADVAVKVIDGQLWVRSRVGMLGYYGDDPIDPDAWRPTGDLVEIDGERIVFRGRASDIINVGGVKVHPLPIEERIAGVPGVGMVRVFGRPNPLTGAIVAVEVVAVDGVDQDEVRDAIRAACEELLPAARPRSIRFVETIDTVGEKISRQVSARA